MNDTQLPTTCPKCGKPLRERKGKYGSFLGCMGYPECNYTYDISETSRILCPICDKKLKIRIGGINKYLSCSGYPECTFRYFPDDEHQEFVLSCPDCKNDLIQFKDHKGLSIVCRGCTFKLSMNRDDVISCPNCMKPLRIRTGRYGRFLGCSGYPDCRFTINLEKSYSSKTKNLYCPKCGSILLLKSGRYGEYFKCSASPKCEFTYNLSKFK